MSNHKASDSENTDPRLCRDFDLYNAEHSERVYEILGYAQQHCPVLPTPADGGYFVVTRYDDVRTVLQNPQTFSSRKASLRGTGGVRVPPIDTDPPLHHDFRKVLNPFFHPNYLKRYEAGMAGFAASRIDQWIERGECDFIDEFARPYIADVLALVVFNEDDPELFRRAGEINHEMATNASAEIFQQFADLIAEFIDRRVAAGVKKDDVVTAIIEGSVGGRPMTKEEQVGVVQLLFSGGLDTTIVALSNIMLHITEQPELEDELRSGDWIRTHFDEFLRFESPVSAEPRLVNTDTILGDQQLRKDDTLLVHYAVANRDPDRFANPHELDFTNNNEANAAFGLGIHRCIGVHLARLQVKVAYEVLLRRLTNFQLQADGTPKRLPGTTRLLSALPITFDARPAS